MDEQTALQAFAALSNETRLRVFRKLVEAGPAGVIAGDIAVAVGASPSRASFHLSALVTAGLVTHERQARQIIYRADFDGMGQLLNYLIEDCCGGHPVVRACCTGGSCC